MVDGPTAIEMEGQEKTDTNTKKKKKKKNAYWQRQPTPCEPLTLMRIAPHRTA